MATGEQRELMDSIYSNSPVAIKLEVNTSVFNHYSPKNIINYYNLTYDGILPISA